MSMKDSLVDVGLSRSQKARLDRYRRAWHRLIKNPLSVLGILIILSVVLLAIFAPYIAPDPASAGDKIAFDKVTESPSIEHPMGTDKVGRDILSRVIFGSRISLMLGGVVLTIAISIGVTAGLVAGYLGGYTRAVIMRITDVFLAVPPVLLALAVTTILTPSLFNAMIAIAFSWWAWYARLVQGEVLSVKEDEYIEASESLGTGWINIIRSEILPNIVAPITVKATLDMGSVILIGAGLSFLGLGATPPTPSWGGMIAIGRDYLTSAWWMATFPGLAISYTVLGFNLLGDGLRDMFDVEVEEQ